MDPALTVEVSIDDGIDADLVEDALRMSYDAFSAKLRFGFRSADDLVRFFADSVDGTSCLSAAANGRLAGFLAFRTAEREFYRVNAAALARFPPVRAVRILINLGLLAVDSRVGDDEFVVDSVAVARSARGAGVGTALMRAAETTAIRMDKSVMSLGVIGENAGAIRLYERLGYRVTRTWRGLLPRLATGGSNAVHRMEKRLDSGVADQ